MESQRKREKIFTFQGGTPPSRITHDDGWTEQHETGDLGGGQYRSGDSLFALAVNPNQAPGQSKGNPIKKKGNLRRQRGSCKRVKH